MESKEITSILFSPVSGRDPCSEDPNYANVYRDGALLHIVRNYRPQKVVLFLTKDFQHQEEEDHRYTKMLEHVSPGIECELKFCPEEIGNAALFDQYDEYFRRLLGKLHEENPDAQILVNVTSGTPQMQSALYLLAATLPYQVKAVQVLSPAKGHNRKHSDYDEHLAETRLGEDGAIHDVFGPDGTLIKFDENRCKDVTCRDAVRIVLAKNIAALVEKYDYTAAREFLNTTDRMYGKNELFTPKSTVLLRLVIAHLHLSGEDKNLTKALKSNGLNWNDFYEQPVAALTDDTARRCYDYLTYLQTLVESKAYSDFARALSPALTTVMKLRLKKAGFPIDKLIFVDRNGVARVTRRTLERKNQAFLDYLDRQYSNDFKDGPLSALHMLHYMNYLQESNQGCNIHVALYETLRSFEEQIRNLAAHEMRGITQDDFHNVSSSLDAQSVLNLLRQEYECAIGATGLKWDALMRMNRFIIQELDNRPEQKGAVL